MIFGNKDEYDFESFKNDVNSAAEPLVEAVSKYEPNKKKRRSYKSPVANLPESAALFFQAAADTLEKKTFKTEDSDTGDTVVSLDQLGKQASEVQKAAGKKAGWLFGKASDAADNTTNAVKDAKLDQKLGDLAGNASDSVKNARLDKKFGKLVDNVSDSVKDAKLDKKLGKLADNASDTVKNAKLDKRFGTLVDNASDTIKDAKLDKKFGNAVDSVTSAVKDAKLDKKAGDVVDTVVPVVASVASTVSDAASTALDAVGSFIKDNKLDKKAAETVTTVADTAGDTLSSAADWTGQAIKDAKLDKKLADAQIPEKLFAAANIIPGVTVKNPRKAAKQFRKTRNQAFKTAQKQQKQLGKFVSGKQKDASKFLAPYQKEAGKFLAPYQKEAGKIINEKQQDAQKFIAAKQKDAGKLVQSKQKDAVKLLKTQQKNAQQLLKSQLKAKKKASPWMRAGRYAAGAGLVYGGLAFNNARIWNAVAPLESKLPGDNRYFNSRQGLVFYKEAGQEQGDKAPVVFVHGIGAGAHSYEWLHNFEAFSQQYKVYAYDLLGFGNSAKPVIKYTAETYIKQLTEFLDEVVGRPAYIVASSLSSAYAVQVAYRRPELVKKLLLVSPTGINQQGGKTSVQIVPKIAYYLLRLPVLGKALYSLIAGKGDIRHFSENHLFNDPSQMTNEVVDQYYISSHQPGADIAPPSFFTGLLDAEIGQTLSKVQQPTLLVSGKNSNITPLWEQEALKKQNPDARLETLDNAKLAVQWERADDFNRMGMDFLAQPDKEITATGVGLGQTGETERRFSDKSNGAQKATEKVGEVAGHVKEAAGDAAHKVKDVVSNVTKHAGETAANVTKQAKQTASDTSDKVQEAADKLSDEFKNDAKDAAKSADSRTGKAAQSKPTAPAANSDSPNEDLSRTMGHFGQQAQPANHETHETMEAATEYPGDHDLKKELQEHRETFIGDSETGAALVEDKDNNGVDDRRMGPLG